MSRLWKIILKTIESDGEVIFAEGYLKAFGFWDEFCGIKKTGIFQQTSPARTIFCPGCDEHCIRELIHKPSGCYVYCDQDNTSREEINQEDLRQWKLEISLLVYWLHKKLQIKDEIKTLEKNSIWRLGTYKLKDKFAIMYFACSADLIEKYKNQNVIFLVPFLPDKKVVSMEKYPLISLSDFLKLDSEGVGLDLQLFHYFLEASLEKLCFEKEEISVFPEYFKFSEDYRNIIYKDKKFELTPMQGLIIGHLIEKYQVGEKSVAQEEILKSINSKSSRIKDLFKKNNEAYRTMIKKSKIKGMFSLNFE